MPSDERPVTVDESVELPVPAPGERWTAGAVVAFDRLRHDLLPGRPSLP